MRRLLVIAPLALLGMSLPLPASAQEAPGSAFASVSLTSVASGVSYLFVKEVPAETTFPYAASELRLGAGSAVGTVAWPGAIGASLGTTLIVAGGAPQEAEVLNHPAAARAQSGSGPATVSNTTVPGAVMTAHATQTEASAVASLDGAGTSATTTGQSASDSAVTLTGPATATGSGSSAVRDVSIGGVVRIGSVVSTATATTDGARASARGATLVGDVTVAGIPVIVDGNGLSVAGNAVPAGPLLAQVQAALSQAQITLTLSQPATTTKGGMVEYSTGSLIVSTPFGTVSLGGVQMRLAATRALPLLPAIDTPVAVPGPVLAPGTSDVVGGTPAPGGVGAPSGVLPTVVRDLVQAALLPVSVVTGYHWWWWVLALMATAASATLLGGLPARTLPALKDGCRSERTW